MGDEMPSNGNHPASASSGAASQQNTQDLLADIFGGGSTSSSTSAASSKPRSTVDDIMGLFGNTGAAASSSTNAGPSSSSNGLDMLSGMSSQPAPAASQPAPPATQKSQLQSYTAYEKNGLKITLTPKTSPTQPGMVQILARFTCTGSDLVQGVNFQAAVPKVTTRDGLL